MTPYKCVFGIEPRMNELPGAPNPVMMDIGEIDIDADLEDIQITLPHHDHPYAHNSSAQSEDPAAAPTPAPPIPTSSPGDNAPEPEGDLQPDAPQPEGDLQPDAVETPVGSPGTKTPKHTSPSGSAATDQSRCTQCLHQLSDHEVTEAALPHGLADEDLHATLERHVLARKSASAAYLQSANKMLNRGLKRKRVEEFAVGDNVTIKIPCADRHKTDNKRLPGVIVEVRGEKNRVYSIQ